MRLHNELVYVLNFYKVSGHSRSFTRPALQKPPTGFIPYDVHRGNSDRAAEGVLSRVVQIPFQISGFQAFFWDVKDAVYVPPLATSLAKLRDRITAAISTSVPRYRRGTCRTLVVLFNKLYTKKY